ncbi:MAG: hypothetical protein D8M59_00495 [Planctomycetes bacterium]|nr:hypothetical protein [Planctomycetota bacterium]
MADQQLEPDHDVPVVRPAEREHAASGLSVRDARGRSVAPLDPVKARLAGRRFGDNPDLHAAILREIGSGLSRGMNWAVAVFLCTFGIVAIIYIFTLFTSPLATQQAWSHGAIVAVGFQIWLWPFLIWHRARRGRLERIHTVMLRYNVCPHCGYDLHALPPDPSDGATLCPECGCAWFLDSAEQAGAATPIDDTIA